MLKLCQSAKQLKTASRCPLEISELEGKHWYKHSNSKNAPCHCTGSKWKVCVCADCWMCPWFYEVFKLCSGKIYSSGGTVDHPLFRQSIVSIPSSSALHAKVPWDNILNPKSPVIPWTSNASYVKCYCETPMWLCNCGFEWAKQKDKMFLNLNRNTKCSWDKVFCFEGFYSLSKVLDKAKLCTEHGYAWTIKGSWKFIVN